MFTLKPKKTVLFIGKSRNVCFGFIYNVHQSDCFPEKLQVGESRLLWSAR